MSHDPAMGFDGFGAKAADRVSSDSSHPRVAGRVVHAAYVRRCSLVGFCRYGDVGGRPMAI